jgi:hypothetical protein
MSSICDRLREMADLFEAQQAPPNFVLHLRAGADEIERLRSGGCARDQGLTQYCAEAAALTARVAQLEAALRDIAKVTRGWEPGVWSDEEGRKYFAALFFRAQDKARAALTQPAEEKPND